MSAIRLEHVNFTVSNAEATASMLQTLFGWHIRWRGTSNSGWPVIHVGSETSYLALFQPRTSDDEPAPTGGRFNHVGVEVEDLDAVEAKLHELGLKAHHADDYDPGRRFYFFDPDGIEYEVVSYR